MKKAISLVRSLRKLVEPRFDPTRTARVQREFDSTRGYDAYHAYCQSRCCRRLECSDSALAREGFQYVEVFDDTTARELLEQATGSAALTYVKKDTRNLEGYPINDRVLAAAMLGAALPGAIDTLATAFFKSEYLVYWFTLTRTPRAREQASVSFRWHCDMGPSSHLKLMIYLNSYQSHGGGTAFLDLADTARLADSGYVFGRTRQRIREIDELARLAGRELRPSTREFAAGQGVLFQPARVLHTGLTPTLGARFVLTLCLLPSPVHWAEAWQRGAMIDLVHATKWHRDAAGLLAMVEPLAGR